ncbi:MAG: hypothetical protein ACKOAU_10870 [Pirellula sp.]
MTNQIQTIERLRRILTNARIDYDERSVRDGYHMLQATVPGQRWEIEVDSEGNVEFEMFRSGGDILGEKELLDAIAKFADS